MLVVTFALTMMIPLQYAVLVGVGLSVILHVVRQSNQVIVKRQQVDTDGHLVESDPPAVLPGGEVVVLQPYGSLFFAAAPVFEGLLPQVKDDIAPQRGHPAAARTQRSRLDRPGRAPPIRRRRWPRWTAGSSSCPRTNASTEQLAISGITDVVGPEWIYRGDERVGATLQRAEADAAAWVAGQQGEGRQSDGR